MKIERIQQIYDDICKYSIQLAADPTACGPRYLHDQMSTCRNYLNAVSAILLEIHREKHNLANDLAGEETVYAIEADQLLSNDERVRRLPNIDDRKAAINILLRSNVARISALKREIQDLDYVEKAVKHRHRELKDTMSEIKVQRGLIRDELDTKSFYGDERAAENPGMAEEGADDLSADDIARMMAEEQAGQPEAASAVAPPEPVPETPPSVVAPVPEPTTDTTPTDDTDEQSIEAFLAEGFQPQKPAEKKPAEDDFSDLFDRI